MNEVMIGALAGLAGLAVGALFAAALFSRRLMAAREEIATHAATASQLDVQLRSAREGVDAERAKVLESHSKLATAEADVVNLRARLEEEGRRITEMQAQLRVEFENLAGRILEEKSVRFLAQNQESLGAILDPLKQRLGEFRERVEAIHTEDTKTTAALREQLQNLRDLNRQMTDEAGALTRALKGESKTQGSWGELILERILEKSGLQKGIEYETQASFRDAEGSRLMPDVIIKLPEDRHLIIDAKVSLTAYERWASEENEAARIVALREHTASVRRHVDELSRKDYAGLPGLHSPDFVLMFVPVEPALHLALQQDTELYGHAFDKNVVLVSSSTLLVTLRAVESVWRRHRQTLNAQKIAQQAGSLHDQFVRFIESLQEIGDQLSRAQKSYDQALARLSTGRGNLVNRVRELEKLGARIDKQIPSGLVEQSTESESLPEPQVTRD